MFAGPSQIATSDIRINLKYWHDDKLEKLLNFEGMFEKYTTFAIFINDMVDGKQQDDHQLLSHGIEIYIYFSIFHRILIHCYLVIIEFAKKNSNWLIICIEYLHKEQELTKLSSLSSDILKSMGSFAADTINNDIKKMPTMEKKEMILFASEYGTIIANQFGIQTIEKGHFHIKNYFGESHYHS